MGNVHLRHDLRAVFESASSSGNSGSAPGGRFGHEAALVGNRLFIWGGAQRHKGAARFADRRDIWCLDTTTSRWRKRKARAGTKQDIPPSCVDAQCAVIDGIVYSFGGCTDVSSWSCLNDVHALDIQEIRWKRVEVTGDRPTQRTACGICAIQGCLLIVGGYGRQIQGRLSVGAQFIENLLYPQNGWNNQVLLFSPLSCSWRPVHTKGPRPLPRAHHSLTACNDHTIVLFGGRSQSGRLNDLYTLNILTEEWSPVALSAHSQWPEPRAAHTTSCLSSNYLLVLGGWDQYDGVTSEDYIVDKQAGNAQKITFVGQPAVRANHSACCQQCPDGAVSVILFGGTKEAVCSHKTGLDNLIVYRWEPSQPTVLEEINDSRPESSSSPCVSANGQLELNSKFDDDDNDDEDAFPGIN